MIVSVIGAAVVVVAGFLSIWYFGPRILLMPDRRGPDFYRRRFGFSHPADMGLTYEDGTLVSGDGLNLSYWVVESPARGKCEGIVIYLHGITDSKVSGLNYARELVKSCFKVYLIDLRSHGESEGRYCTYGYYEKQDVSKLIDRIRSRDADTDISLLGVSMGAAIAIQTAAIDSRVSKVVAIAPFYDLFSIAYDHEVRKIGIGSKTLLKLVALRSERIAGFKVSEVSPANDIKNIHVPIMIVHGESDKTVKEEYSRTLQQLSNSATFILIPGAGHTDVLEKGGKEFVESLAEFLKSDKKKNPPRAKGG